MPMVSAEGALGMAAPGQKRASVKCSGSLRWLEPQNARPETLHKDDLGAVVPFVALVTTPLLPPHHLPSYHECLYFSYTRTVGCNVQACAAILQ